MRLTILVFSQAAGQSNKAKFFLLFCLRLPAVFKDENLYDF